MTAHPDRINDILIAGELYMKTGEPQTALSLLQRAETKKPSAHVELLMAMVYLRMKQPQRAKALLDRAKARNPKNVDIFRAVATYYRETHDYKSAIETLKQAPRKDADLLAELGYTYELAGMKKESAETYEKAAGMAPQVINIQLAAAQAELRVGNLDKTRSYLARGEQLDPKYYRLHAIRSAVVSRGGSS